MMTRKKITRTPSDDQPREHSAKRQGRRRFLVQEVTSWMGYSGSTWAVGCTTLERALQSFDGRVVRNSLEEGDAGGVHVYDRELRQVIAWSSDLARDWFKSLLIQRPEPEEPAR